MKKCLKLSVFSLLLSTVALFSACKDDEDAGNPNPITKVVVEDADVLLDNANKRIDVLFYKYRSLSDVIMTFEFADGARLYSPLSKNPATLDLSGSTGTSIVVMTGDQKVYYNVYGAIDYPLMSMNITGDNGEVVGVASIDQNTKVITSEFKGLFDLKHTTCKFNVSKNGGQMVSPAQDSLVMDLTQENTIKVKSTRGGELTYTMKAAESPKTDIPEGWAEVTNAGLPSHMALFKTSDFEGNTAYAVVADSRAKFSVMSEGIKNTMTIPDFYSKDNTASVIINGSAVDNMIVVEGQVVNVGTSSSTVATGVTKSGQLLMGTWSVDYEKAKCSDSTGYYGLYGTTMLIKNNTKTSGLNTVDRNAFSAIGHTLITKTDGGCWVFLVAQYYGEGSTGVTPQSMCNMMADWNCANAMLLEGGSGSCMYVEGKPTISSTKGPSYFKSIGCCAVLK